LAVVKNCRVQKTRPILKIPHSRKSVFRKSLGLKEDSAVDCPYEKKTLVEEFFWMIEEYKVSLFAQELKTPYPVSPKKLNQLIEKIEER